MLFEKSFDQCRHVGHFDDLDARRGRGVGSTVAAYENIFESQTGGLGYASVGLADGTYLAAQAHFAGKAAVKGQGIVEV